MLWDSAEINESTSLVFMSRILYTRAMTNSENLTRSPLSYLRELGAAIAAYTVLLVISLLLLNRLAPTSIWRAPIALLPMVGGVAMVVAVVRQLHRMDELERLQLLESLAIAFAGTAVVTLSYGFLENVGFPHVSWFFVWPVMAALWIVGSAVGSLRYKG